LGRAPLNINLLRYGLNGRRQNVLKLNKILQSIELALGTIIVFGMLILVTVNVVLRYFLGYPLMWADEVSCFALIAITFLAIPYLFSRGEHVALTLLQNTMSLKIKNIIEIGINALIILCFVILYPSCLRCIGFLTPSPALRLDLAYIFVLLPISYALLIYHGLCNIIRVCKTPRCAEEAK
jgi:TRAP-type C4-dicarboxylate transport system permease small subunit